MRLRFIFLLLIGLGVFAFYKKSKTTFFRGNKHIPTRNLATVTVLSKNKILQKPKPPKPKEINIIKEETVNQSEDKQIVNIKPSQKNQTKDSNKKSSVVLEKLKPKTKNKLNKELLLAVEQMPNFPGCKEMNEKEQKFCSDNKLLRFLNKNIQYPKAATLQGIQGTVYVSFIIEKSGKISNANIIRDIGGGCGEEALRVVKSMPTWNSGKQNGKAVSVRFNLPVKFQL